MGETQELRDEVERLSPWVAVDEVGNDNFATSIYEADFKGLLIARCNQNGQYPWQAAAIIRGLEANKALPGSHPDTARAEKAESSLAEREEEIGALRRALEMFVPELIDSLADCRDDEPSHLYRRTTVGQLRHARALLASSDKGKAGGWLPIETAPKDGTVVLIAQFFEAYPRWVVVCGHFVKVGRRKGTWFEVNDDGRDEFSQPYEPTHWRPLPAPPSEGA